MRTSETRNNGWDSHPHRGRWLTLGVAAALVLAAVPGGVTANEQDAPAAAQQMPEAAEPTTPADSIAADVPTNAAIASAPAAALPNGPIRMSFQDAPLRTVLTYLSEAAGLVIIEPANVQGRVTVTSRQSLSTDEAVALLDTVLRQNGYAAIYSGRTLRIITLEEAATSNIPVHVGADPRAIEPTDKVVTQIVPVRYVNAVRLRTDLAGLFPDTAGIAANEGSNSLVITDSQLNIRRIVSIIQALDQHLAAVAEVRVFQLTYADATSTAALITQVFRPDEESQARAQAGGGFAARMQTMMRGRPGGTNEGDQDGAIAQRVVASADQRTNAVVVSAPPELMAVIEGVVRELDSNPAEEQTVFHYYLENAQADNVATVLNNIFSESTQTTARGTAAARRQVGQAAQARQTTAQTPGAGGLVGDVYVVAHDDTNSLLVRTSTRSTDLVKQVIKQLDRPLQQVLIKVLIAEVLHEDLMDVGGQFSALNLRLGAAGDYNVNLNSAVSTGGVLTATMDANLAATFEALRREGKMDVLSRPYILASDNQQASIVVGEEVPYIINTRVTDQGQTINTIQYQDVGIILNVTPHINPQGLVIMDVSPEISGITDATVPISETVNATVFSKRSASTRVAVPNGQTIVIGGLMEDSISKMIRKVPLLGDIPLLRGLFRRTVDQKVKTELLIFLTPHVASEADDLARISDAEAAGATAVKSAVGQGAFAEHMRAMQRGVEAADPGETDAPAQ